MVEFDKLHYNLAIVVMYSTTLFKLALAILWSSQIEVRRLQISSLRLPT